MFRPLYGHVCDTCDFVPRLFVASAPIDCPLLLSVMTSRHAIHGTAGDHILFYFGFLHRVESWLLHSRSWIILLAKYGNILNNGDYASSDDRIHRRIDENTRGPTETLSPISRPATSRTWLQFLKKIQPSYQVILVQHMFHLVDESCSHVYPYMDTSLLLWYNFRMIPNS